MTLLIILLGVASFWWDLTGMFNVGSAPSFKLLFVLPANRQEKLNFLATPKGVKLQSLSRVVQSRVFHKGNQSMPGVVILKPFHSFLERLTMNFY